MNEKNFRQWNYLKRWRNALDTSKSDHDKDSHLADRGDRARLRRCRSIDEVLLTPVFYDVRERLRDDGFDFDRHRDSDERLACVLGLIAWVEEDASDEPFRRQLGRKRKGSEEARLSGLRFRRLLDARDRAELFELMRPVVDLLGRSANVRDFATNIYEWSPDPSNWVRRVWAEGYYTAAPREM